MNTPTLSTHADSAKSRFAMAARVEQIERTARALAAHGFTVEVLDDAQAARTRLAALLPVGAAVYMATPDFVVGSVSAVTEDGALVAVSATGSQLPAYAGGASKVIWIVGAQKIVPDLAGALHRIETYAYPLEDVRARATYGRPSAINKILIVNAEPAPGRTTVLLLHQAVGF
jgi:hypothetical protein